MIDQWIGFTSDECRDELEQALRQVSPRGHLVFARDAADIRCRLRDEEPGTVGAIVGLSAVGVSDVNLAAALASDHLAREVVLVARFVTGSLRSRATQAGISRVIDIDDVLFDQLALGETVAPSTAGSASEAPAEQPAAKECAAHSARAPIVVFSSGRGGVGKTALCAVSAMVADRWGIRVAVLDLDLACGNLPSCFGVTHWQDLASLVEKGALESEAVHAAGSGVTQNVRIWGPCALPEMAEQVMPHTGRLLELLAEDADLVLVDTSSTCTDAVAQAMQLADRLVLVHDDGPSAITYLARTSALAVRLGVPRARIMRVENGCLTRLVGTPFTPLADLGLETARAFRVPDGGDDVRDLLSAGHAEELRNLGGEFVRGVTKLLACVLSELGRLPDVPEARRAADLPKPRKGLQLFSRKREVA